MEKKAPSTLSPLGILTLVRFLRYARERHINQGWTDTSPIGMAVAWVDGLPPPASRADLIARQIGEAEEDLKRHGWRMNKTGKVARIRKGRGADLLAECVWELYLRDHVSEGNTEDVRRKIAAELAPFFDAADLDPRSGAPIFRAIYNREYRRL